MEIFRWREFFVKTAGIICEYDPFHLGHWKQLRLVRKSLGEDAAVVCVMSGNYVQRGLPAMWDKYTRANAAAACGADVVLELPMTCVLQSAEGFARGGVEVLTRFGGVDVLSFGAECGDGDRLMTLARQLRTPEYRAALQCRLHEGMSYPAARQAALHDPEDLLSRPNNILGLEYCRAILDLQSPLRPLAVRRDGDYHAEAPDAEAPSATAVRRLFPDGPWRAYVPAPAAALLASAPWYALEYGERAVLARLRALPDAAWEAAAHGSEGLWSKAKRAARTQPDLESVVQAVKSKRYPRTRIQRLLLCAYLGLTAEDLTRPVSYVRILAASPKGRTLLRRARDRGDLPLVNPGQTPPDRDYYALETRGTDLFTLFAAPGFPTPCGAEQNARWKP